MAKTAFSLAEEVKAMNRNCQNDRLKFLIDKLVDHLHAYVVETSLTADEWSAAIHFLGEAGKVCAETRQEFDILSGVLGVTTLVEDINNGKPAGATEPALLGPFFKEDAHKVENGDSIASEGKGDYPYVEGRVLDLQGNPVANATIDTWEADSSGLYDFQYENQEDCRGRLHTAEDGSFSFRAIVPVPYPIPEDGPAANLLTSLGRHVYRPAHLHFVISAPGYESVTTQFYFKGDPYLTSDATFGVKPSLIVTPEIVEDLALSKARGFKDAKPHTYIKKDFVLVTPEQGINARAAVAAQN
ncbi:Hydroxyquinol 1,2-dioxygenase [Psilocybe cubensis]|uniref:Hydroxyquinol 1,2-dioxygenase n=2 Tax=Psilocybe cubensis TaxID=181762 RepID=A0ACB8GFF7_PSICU|nr:Hydroxyquinol 1,2-dioxygenase [Psilocybe cubensis]KAH9474339.1 Hydroxyquinol 1,2-dioxygenase [Psilocybe cubensis]